MRFVDEAGSVFAQAVAQEVIAVGEELLAEDFLFGEGWDGEGGKWLAEEQDAEDEPVTFHKGN